MHWPPSSAKLVTSAITSRKPWDVSLYKTWILAAALVLATEGDGDGLGSGSADSVGDGNAEGVRLV